MTVELPLPSPATRTSGSLAVRPPRLNPLSFAPLPLHALLDRQLNATARDLLAALLLVARDDSSCWPSNRTLAHTIGRSERTVQLNLRLLERAQWARSEADPTNHTGRRIFLCWRETAPPGTTYPLLAPALNLVPLLHPSIQEAEFNRVAPPFLTRRHSTALRPSHLDCGSGVQHHCACPLPDGRVEPRCAPTPFAPSAASCARQ